MNVLILAQCTYMYNNRYITSVYYCSTFAMQRIRTVVQDLLASVSVVAVHVNVQQHARVTPVAYLNLFTLAKQYHVKNIQKFG